MFHCCSLIICTIYWLPSGDRVQHIKHYRFVLDEFAWLMVHVHCMLYSSLYHETVKQPCYKISIQYSSALCCTLAWPIVSDCTVAAYYNNIPAFRLQYCDNLFLFSGLLKDGAWWLGLPVENSPCGMGWLSILRPYCRWCLCRFSWKLGVLARKMCLPAFLSERGGFPSRFVQSA